MINIINDIEEMARIGFMKNNIEIVIRTNDSGKIPHFHFFDRNRDKDNEGCIRIDKPEYFNHSGKNLELNSSQKKELVEFLSSVHNKKRSEDTNWKFLLQMWNDNNSDVEVDERLGMPDYTLLK